MLAARKLCSINRCTGRVHARGWCNTHYKCWLLHGDPLYKRTSASRWDSIEARLLRYIDFTAPGGHWLWTGHLDQKGYAMLYWHGRDRRVHRLMWKYWMDSDGIPDDLEYCHDPLGIHGCPKHCVNPHHAIIGSKGDNARSWDHTGDRVWCATTPDDDVELAKEFYKKGDLTQKSVALMFGVSQKTVSNWVRGKQEVYITNRSTVV